MQQPKEKRVFLLNLYLLKKNVKTAVRNVECNVWTLQDAVRYKTGHSIYHHHLFLLLHIYIGGIWLELRFKWAFGNISVEGSEQADELDKQGFLTTSWGPESWGWVKDRSPSIWTTRLRRERNWIEGRWTNVGRSNI